MTVQLAPEHVHVLFCLRTSTMPAIPHSTLGIHGAEVVGISPWNAAALLITQVP